MRTDWELKIDFDADPDWTPLRDACWIDCPLKGLTKLGHVCRAKEVYDKYGDTEQCPLRNNITRKRDEN